MSVRPSDSVMAMERRLIGFDTTSRNSNLALIDSVRAYLAEHGVESELVPDETGKKANLYASIGPKDRGGVILSGHTDVVPVDGQPWDTDPWQIVERDDRLYGRGTSDMKSFVAIALAYVPQFVKAPLKTPVHLAFSYDEEVGCIGVRRLIAQIAARPIKPKLCIIGEPTDMKPIAQHKGKVSWRGRVRGHECHSSMTHRGANAVEAAAEIVARLKALARGKAKDGPFDREFDPPYTTVHTGTIRGGTALNIVPLDCSFDFEIRHLPIEDPRALFAPIAAYAGELQSELQRAVPEASIAFEELTATPGLASEPDDPAVTLARQLTGANSSGKVSFGTEGGLFQQAGIPTVVCGPGSIAQAHQPNEWVALDQLVECERFMQRLLQRLTTETL
jgi:acetylornithine deacetylase